MIDDLQEASTPSPGSGTAFDLSRQARQSLGLLLTRVAFQGNPRLPAPAWRRLRRTKCSNQLGLDGPASRSTTPASAGVSGVLVGTSAADYDGGKSEEVLRWWLRGATYSGDRLACWVMPTTAAQDPGSWCWCCDGATHFCVLCGAVHCRWPSTCRSGLP